MGRAGAPKRTPAFAPKQFHFNNRENTSKKKEVGNYKGGVGKNQG